jgi:inorganic phosphate transporter, PiT family
MNSSLAAPLFIGLIATALLFDFLNGLHDAAKARQPMLED